MAFTRAGTSDTNPKILTKAYGTLTPTSGVSPLTGRTAISGRLPTGRSNLKFGSTNVPQPARTAGNPDIAPARNTNIRGGQGPKENQLRNAITGLGKKFGRQIGSFIGRELDFSATRQGFEELESGASSPGGAFTPEGQQVSFGSSQSFITPVQSFSAVPSFSGAIQAGFNEGGFIRKRT